MCGYVLTSYFLITTLPPLQLIPLPFPWYARPCFKPHINPIHKSRYIYRHRRPIARGRSRFGGPNCKRFAPAHLLTDRDKRCFIERNRRRKREMQIKFKKKNKYTNWNWWTALFRRIMGVWIQSYISHVVLLAEIRNRNAIWNGFLSVLGLKGQVDSFAKCLSAC